MGKHKDKNNRNGVSIKMNRNVRIFIDAEQAIYSKSGAVSTPIFFRIAEDYFPSKGWIDFSLILLTWWIDAINSRSDQVKLDFMDGPYFLKVARNQSSFDMEGIRRTKTGHEVLIKASVDSLFFSEAVQNSARKLLSKLDRDKVDSSDLRGLELALS